MFYFFGKIFQDQKGQSLVEAFFAIVFFTVFVSAIMGLIQGVYRSDLYVDDHETALSLAREGLEAVYSIRDALITNLSNGSYGITQAGGFWAFSGTSDTVGKFTRVITISDVFRDANGDYVSSGGVADPRSKKVVVEVSWVDDLGENKNMVLEGPILQDFKTYDWKEDTDIDFNDGVFVNTLVSGMGDNAVLELEMIPGGGTLVQETQVDFGGGTYLNTEYDTDHIELTAAGLSVGFGTYTSEIFDNGSVTSWNQFSWTPLAPYGKELPDNGVSETDYSFGNANMTDNILLLHLNEPSGSTSFADTSGQGNNGSCAGNQCPLSGQTGLIKRGLRFDGSNDRVELGYFDVNGTGITLSVWVYFDDFDRNSTFIAKTSGRRPRDYYWGLMTRLRRRPRFRVKINGITRTLTHNVNLNTGEIYHLVGTYNGSRMILYKNGVEVRASNRFGTISTDGSVPVMLGYNYPAGRYPFDGFMDEVAVWERALSSTEVQNLYQRGVNRIRFQLRSCDDVNCAGETFVGPDGTSGDYYWEADNNSIGLPSFPIQNLANNRYFQYLAGLETGDSNFNPGFSRIQIDYGSGGGGYYTSGSYLSSVFDSGGTGTFWNNVFWKEVVPVNTDLTVAVRSGDTPVPDGSWSSFSAELTDPNFSNISSSLGRYLQYRVSLTSDGSGTPELDWINVTYKP